MRVSQARSGLGRRVDREGSQGTQQKEEGAGWEEIEEWRGTEKESVCVHVFVCQKGRRGEGREDEDRGIEVLVEDGKRSERVEERKGRKEWEDEEDWEN